MNRHKRRWLGWLVAGLVLAALAAAIAVFFARVTRSAEQQWRTQYRTATVEAIVFAETVEITGNLRPIDARDLSFPVGGRVTAVPAAVGARMAEGAVVARLEDSKARYELASVESQLQQKRLSGASREIEMLELQRQIAAQAVADHVLRSPLSGRVSEVDIRPGEYVAAGRRVARVIDDSSFKAKVQIDELDSPRVRLGQPVRFSFDALPGLAITGAVLSLAVEGRVTPQGLAVRDGEVQIENPPAELLSGYSFTGQILLGREERVLAVPVEAVLHRGTDTFLLLPPTNSGQPERQPVEATILDHDRIRIRSGVSEGQTILVPLYPGVGAGTDKLSTKGLLDSLKRRSRIPLLKGQ